MDVVGLEVPAPMIVSIAIFLVLVILIADTGGGWKLLFPLLRPFMRPYRPSNHYNRIKSKYVI